MAGRQPKTTAGRSLPIKVVFCCLFSFITLAVLYLLSSPYSSSAFESSFPLHTAAAAVAVASSQPPDYSFITSLQNFLSQPQRRSHDVIPPSPEKLDDSIWSIETNRLYNEFTSPFPIRVYVYEMPSKFTIDLLKLFIESYRETSNHTSNGSPIHRLIEQHSVDYWLWADLIAPADRRPLNNVVVRVHKQEEADLFYIPYFSTISKFLLEDKKHRDLNLDASEWVTSQPAWKRSGGRDHILPVHHPWSLKSRRWSMKKAIWLLPDMDSTGNWYKPGHVYLEKDIILPYVANVDFCDSKCLSDSESRRTTLLFFRGRLQRKAGGKIREQLVPVLSGAEGVTMEEGTAGEAGKKASQSGMRTSKFCLCPAGDTPSSARLFDAIVSGCIPVIVSDELELPFEGILDYRKIALFVSSSDALQPGWVVKFLRGISHSQIRQMQINLAKYSRHFLYSHPAQPLGPEDLAWRMIGGKFMNMKLHIRRSQRVVKESRSVCSCECSRPKAKNSTIPS